MRVSAKRIRKIIYSMLFTSIILLCSSCGIPTIANFDDYLTVSSINSNDVFTINLESTDNKTFNSNSPALLLMYNITDASGSSSLISTSTFNSTYGQISSGRPVNFSNDYSSETSNLKVQGAILNRTITTNTIDPYHIALFPFIPENLSNYNNISASSSYTHNLNSILGHTGTASIKLIYNADNGCVEMTINDSETINLFRFNGNSFLSYNDSSLTENIRNDSQASTYGDYWYFRKDGSDLSNMRLNIYAAVNIMGDFSNLYWSDLKNIGSIDIN